MTSKRDFLYASVAVSVDSFVTDDRRFGLHLTMAEGEALDVIFHNPLAFPGLYRLRDLLQRYLPPEPPTAAQSTPEDKAA